MPPRTARSPPPPGCARDEAFLFDIHLVMPCHVPALCLHSKSLICKTPCYAVCICTDAPGSCRCNVMHVLKGGRRPHGCGACDQDPKRLPGLTQVNWYGKDEVRCCGEEGRHRQAQPVRDRVLGDAAPAL